MGKGKSSKKNLKTEAKALKSLKADQTQSPAPGKKSVKILKNIQKQLDEIVSQREIASKTVKKLDKKTRLISKQVEASESQLSKLAFNKDLQRIKASLEKKNKQFEKESTQLSSEISQFKNLTQRVEKKIRKLEQQTVPSTNQFQTLNNNNEHLLKKISNFEEELNQFFDTYIHPDDAISGFSKQLNRLNKVIKQASKDQQKNNKQINQLQNDTTKLKESFQQKTRHLADEDLNLKKGIESYQQEFMSHQLEYKSHQQEYKSHQLEIESNQQKLLAPLESHLHKLEKSIQLLQQEYTEHLKISSGDNNNLSELSQQQHELSDKFNQFNDHLSQSQDELKQHLEQIQKSDKNDNLSERNHSNEALEKLSLQLSDVTEQSNKLQALFDTVQEEQKINNDHHDELSKQYLLQQQQLDKYESQLLQLPTLITLSESSTKHIEKITGSLEQLSDSQNSLSQLEVEQQSKLQSLEQKIDDSHEQHQENINKLLHYQQNLESKAIQSESYQRNVESHQQDIESHQHDIESHQLGIENLQRGIKKLQQNTEAHQQEMDSRQEDMKAHQLDLENHQHKVLSYQQDQSVSLSQLSELIKKRSPIFSLGLVAVLGVAALLYFTQGQHTETEKLIAQIKTDVTNETFTKINALTKQNSAIINQKFNQINDSIQQVSLQAGQKPETINIDALKNTWQEQFTVLQEAMTGTQTKQQELNQTVIKLSESINTVTNQYQLIQKKLSLKAESALQRNNQQTNKKTMEITNLNNTPSFYAIQLLGALQKESVISYIKQHHLTDTTRIHQTEFQGKPWYILVQGHYSSFAQAKEELQQLPDVLQENAPWIKKLP